jgi:hypothetical protein
MPNPIVAAGVAAAKLAAKKLAVEKAKKTREEVYV